MTRATAVPETVTIHVPFRIVKRGGRKEMQRPSDTQARGRPDDTLIKALARAFRWKSMLDNGDFATVADLAAQEGIAVSYLTRVLRLTQLAPDLVEAILDARHPPGLTLQSLRVQILMTGRGSASPCCQGRNKACGISRPRCSFSEPLSGERAAKPKNCALI